MEKQNLIITTSWDDGHPLDLKIAELLMKYGINGTFYVPCKNNDNTVMLDYELLNLAGQFEIGGHTVNHLYLNSLKQSEAKDEIYNCKSIIQEKLGKKISAFCYPGGKFSERDISLVKEAGFLYGRTTALFHNSIEINQSLLNTSVQVYNHKYSTLIKHCTKRYFFSPIFQYNFFKPYHKNFIKLAQTFISNSSDKKVIFHLWGHSWEIEKYDLWYDLEETFRMLKNEKDANFLNNTECWHLAHKQSQMTSSLSNITDINE